MNKNANNVPHQFDSLEYFPSPVKEQDYDMDNGHFNDNGHAIYARFLHKIIDSLSTSTP
ncbi:MAG: hypothetical protein IPN22_11345 [Bacteroidetes bacterium]|nr:hypothetical protein [Bacteroidota bacterium]